MDIEDGIHPLRRGLMVAMAKAGTRKYTEAALLCGVSRNTLSTLDDSTTVGTLRKIAAGLGCEPGELFG